MTEVDRDIVGLRGSMREYVRSGSPTALKSVQDIGKEARNSRKLERHRPDPGAAGAGQATLASLDTFVSNFNSIVKIQGDLNKALNEVMNSARRKAQWYTRRDHS